MTLTDLNKKAQSIFHIPLFIIGIIIIVIFIIFRSSCSHNPITKQNTTVTKSTDTNKVNVITNNDTTNKQKDSTTITITNHNISENIIIPSGHIGNFNTNKINSDTCSPVRIYQTIAREDGGFYLVTAIVDCKKNTVDSMSVYATPVHFDSSFVDTLIYRHIIDSLIITHLKDSSNRTLNNISSTITHNQITYFSVSGFTEYDPFWSNTFSLGLEGTMRLNELFDVIVEPEISVGPNSGLSFKSIFEANIGLQYHIKMFDVTK